jgi:hypothetical protein
VPTDRRPSHFRRLCAAAGLALAVAAALVGAAGTADAAPTKRVANADIAPACTGLTTSRFCTETNKTAGTAAVVDDQRANVGRGYLRLTTPTKDDHVQVFSQALTNHRLSEITDLEFEIYIEKVGTGNDQVAPSINIPIYPNKANVPFSSLVWEPTYTGVGVVKPGQWQKWTPSASKGWWATRTTLDGTKPNELGFINYAATFDQVRDMLPDAVVLGVGLNQGTGSPGLIAGADQLKVNDTTYDFDNPAPTADLGVQIKAPASAKPGTSFPATVRVTNAGTAPARTISTALMLGAGVKVTNAPGGVGLGGVAAYRTPELAAGSSVDFVVTLTVDAGARKPLMLFAATHSLVPDLNAQNNATTVYVPLA